jgi:hypothetical protein
VTFPVEPGRISIVALHHSANHANRERPAIGTAPVALAQSLSVVAF